MNENNSNIEDKKINTMTHIRIATCFLCGEPCEPCERGTHHLCEIAERTLTTAYEAAILEESKERRSNADHGKVA